MACFTNARPPHRARRSFAAPQWARLVDMLDDEPGAFSYQVRVGGEVLFTYTDPGDAIDRANDIKAHGLHVRVARTAAGA